MLSIVAASGTLSAKAIQGEQYFSAGLHWVKSDTLQAFLAVNMAYRTMPFEGRYRMQLQLSLESLVATNKKVVLDHSAADRAFAISKTASPNHPALLVARAQYLLNSGRWKESNELRLLSSRLEKMNPGYPQSWMVVALYNGLHGKRDKASKALMHGIATGGALQEMQTVAGMINLEIVDADAKNIRP